MSIDRPAAEVVVDEALVRRLLADQVPAFADLPLSLVGTGWDNVIHHLGGDWSVPVPRREAAAQLIVNEQQWLPVLAPRLPLAVPVPFHAGHPTTYFPWAWNVLPWFVGQPAATHPPHDLTQAASDLAEFLDALHVPAPSDAPINLVRGGSHAARLERITQRIIDVGASGRLGSTDVAELVRLWQLLAAAPAYEGPPVWLHGDLHAQNLLTHAGRLAAVIDFGDMTAGDPATDLAIAWILFDPPSRARFHDLLAVDAATWTRAMAWALSFAVMYIGAGADDPAMDGMGRWTLAQVLQDIGDTSSARESPPKV